MQLLFPISSNTTFYLNEAGYTCYCAQCSVDTYICVLSDSKKYKYSWGNKDYKTDPGYIPKVLTDTSLLDQIPILVALGLSDKEIIEILRS